MSYSLAHDLGTEVAPRVANSDAAEPFVRRSREYSIGCTLLQRPLGTIKMILKVNLPSCRKQETIIVNPSTLSSHSADMPHSLSIFAATAARDGEGHLLPHPLPSSSRTALNSITL